MAAQLLRVAKRFFDINFIAARLKISGFLWVVHISRQQWSAFAELPSSPLPAGVICEQPLFIIFGAQTLYVLESWKIIEPERLCELKEKYLNLIGWLIVISNLIGWLIVISNLRGWSNFNLSSSFHQRLVFTRVQMVTRPEQRKQWNSRPVWRIQVLKWNMFRVKVCLMWNKSLRVWKLPSPETL